jgi:hypothetical protein
MAEIFVSHSSKDKPLVDFFSNAFAATKVRAIFEEFEAITEGRRGAPEILRDIARSNAIFVLLTRNVESLPHTRDWVVWETGVGAGPIVGGGVANKDLWVYEPWEETAYLTVVIPRLRHYVRFHKNDPWLGYIRSIITSYDDSHILPAIVGGAAVGGGLGGPGGAVVGGGIGLLSAILSQKRPIGFPIVCFNCRSSYNVHLPDAYLRCPVCNCRLQVRFEAA